MTRKYMSDLLLDAGDNLVLIFPQANDARIDIGPQGEVGVPLGRAFFFKVSTASRLIRKYDLFSTLAALTGVTYNYLGDTGHGTGSDVLRISEDDWWAYHFGYSPLQDWLRVYRRMGAQAHETGWEYVTPDRPDPTATPGDPYGFIRGAEVYNYFDPTAETETVSFRNDKAGQLWQFGLYNEHPDLLIDPEMLLVGKAYRLLPIVTEEIMSKVLYGDPGYRRRMVTIGAVRNIREEAFIPREWKLVGNEMYVTWDERTGVPVPAGLAKRIVEGR